MPPVSRPVRRLRTIEIDELPAGTSSSLSPAARSAAVVGGSTDLIGHTLRGSSRVRGAIAIICVLSILLVGPSLPLALLHALWSGRLHLAAALAAVILASALLPVRESALAARLYLQAAGFLRHGVSFWVERRVWPCNAGLTSESSRNRPLGGRPQPLLPARAGDAAGAPSRADESGARVAACARPARSPLEEPSRNRP